MPKSWGKSGAKRREFPADSSHSFSCLVLSWMLLGESDSSHSTDYPTLNLHVPALHKRT